MRGVRFDWPLRTQKATAKTSQHFSNLIHTNMSAPNVVVTEDGIIMDFGEPTEQRAAHPIFTVEEPPAPRPRRDPLTNAQCLRQSGFFICGCLLFWFAYLAVEAFLRDF